MTQLQINILIGWVVVTIGAVLLNFVAAIITKMGIESEPDVPLLPSFLLFAGVVVSLGTTIYYFIRG